jgi:hypothetical protein
MTLQPEAQFAVARTADQISVTLPQGDVEAISVAAISHIFIVTNDSGPWGADVWWLFADEANRHSIAYPQGATGEALLLDWLRALPGFDHEAMTNAMRCTNNAEFLVWRRT